jgi:hypothetical protein
MIKDIRDSINGIVEKNHNSYSVLCKVNSVDTSKLTCYCIPINGGADIIDVRLMADAKNGFLLTPKVGSIVVVSFIDKGQSFVSMVSQVSEVQLNGKNFDGLVKITPLVNKVNALENQINNILNALKATTIPLAPSGSYPFAPLYAAINPIAPITQKSDLENTTILQGDGS